MLSRNRKNIDDTIIFKKFVIKKNKDEFLIDTVLNYFKKYLPKNEYPLRWYITNVKGNSVEVEANILNESKITVTK